MATKQQIQSIKRNIERTIQGLLTKPQEFIYAQTRGFVKPNTLYSIYYTLTKREVYLTGISDTSNSKTINRVKNKTMYSKYSTLKSLKRQTYPKITPANPSESDYRIGEITRYFTQSGNDKSKPIFEISKKDFNSQNSLYNYTSFQWRISGKKEEVIRDNSTTLRDIQSAYPGITKTVFPLQLWIPSKNSLSDLEKKLSLLAKD